MLGTKHPGQQWPILTVLTLSPLLAGGCTDSRPSSQAERSDEASQVAKRPQPKTEPATEENASASGPGQNAPKKAIGSPEDYDAILKKYVHGDYFDYSALKNNPQDRARFNAFLRWQAQADAEAMSRAEQIAFYINAYNACCIKAILDHYPVTSPKEIDDFFDGLTFTVAGEELTIEEIEYQRLIADHKDMRAHFAVVCADRGCLPLKPGAYKAETLDEDLEKAARRFVNHPRQFQVDQDEHVVRISKIFEWYGEKFLKDPDRPVDGKRPELYLTNWVDDETSELLKSGDYELQFLEWDWTLNEAGADTVKADEKPQEPK